jgi:hypothetical protein
MKQSRILTGASVASASSLSSICSVDYIKASLPTENTALQGLVYGDVTANSVYNSSVEAGNNYPAANGRNFCNVTVAYKHDGKNDAVRLSDLYRTTMYHAYTLARRSMCGTTSQNLLNTKAASSPLAAEALPSTLVLLDSQADSSTELLLVALTVAWAGEVSSMMSFSKPMAVWTTT